MSEALKQFREKIDRIDDELLKLFNQRAELAQHPSLALLGEALSYEPYAIVLPRGDWAMRQAVDAALAQIFKSAALPEIYMRWFGAMGRPSPVLEVVFAMGRLPE